MPSVSGQSSTRVRPLASVLFAAMLLVTWTAVDAQEQRRRPGERAERDSAVETQPTPSERSVSDTPAAPKEDASARPDPALQPAVERRRPGAEAPVPSATPTSERRRPATDGPARDASAGARPAVERRRPGQSEAATPTATGERPGPQSPVRDRQPFDFNAATGLQPVAKPPRDANYAKETVRNERWYLTQRLGISDYPWWDPYNQNTLKADRPIFGDWFFNTLLVSDTQYEPRRLPTPVAPQGEGAPGNFDLIGDGDQTLFAQNLVGSFVLYRGDTTFMPPDWEFRFTPIYNFNYAEVEQNRAVRINPARGRERSDNFFAVQELFIDYHIRDVSTQYDFDSVRFGIQPFNVDFRGFLFRDQQFGLRFFGNRRNNVVLYNIAWFRRLEKDTNSELNDIGQSLRDDDVFVFNLYWQDMPRLGFTSQAVVLYNRNTEGENAPFFNNNGFIERPASIGLEKPRSYDVVYLGYNGEGHFGRVNLSASSYLALGSADRGVFVDRETDISAFFGAAEVSVDFDWRRIRLSALYASGDDDPYDDAENGFDAVFENPLFAGADTSFWVRQNVPLIGGGVVTLSGRNGILNSLRSSKAQGQSNFTNPGLLLLGIGADLDLTPQWRVSTNINQLAFADTAVLEAARQQADIDPMIGTDASIAFIWRPYFTQNIVFRASAAALLPGDGFKQLYGDEVAYSALFNLTLLW
ncbi:hypothetical protein [Algiphilus sp.]|uniref:hypothetical protein n=1 Tax=Algiphilus sp. TaxID=1872431 RepID=UPI003B524DE8